MHPIENLCEAGRKLGFLRFLQQPLIGEMPRVQDSVGRDEDWEIVAKNTVEDICKGWRTQALADDKTVGLEPSQFLGVQSEVVEAGVDRPWRETGVDHSRIRIKAIPKLGGFRIKAQRFQVSVRSLVPGGEFFGSQESSGLEFFIEDPGVAEQLSAVRRRTALLHLRAKSKELLVILTRDLRCRWLAGIRLQIASSGPRLEIRARFQVQSEASAATGATGERASEI